MAVDGFKTFHVWYAALFVYLYGWEMLYQICDTEGRGAEYSFAIPSLDAQADIDNYEAGTCTLADAHAFVNAFNWISQTQKKYRSQGDCQWVSPRWVRGEVG